MEMSLVEDDLEEALNAVERMQGSHGVLDLVEAPKIEVARPQEEVLHASTLEEALPVHLEEALAFAVAFLRVERHEPVVEHQEGGREEH